MLKKNIAKAMAAATVLSAAAPMANVAFASEVSQNKEVKELKEKVFKIMNTKFTTDKNLLLNSDVAGQNVFNVKIVSTGGKTYNNYAEFERAFDELYAKLLDGQSIKIDYEYANEIGGSKIACSTLEDGTVVDFVTTKYTNQDLYSIAKEGKPNLPEGSEANIGEVKAIISEDSSRTYAVRLSNDENGLKRFADVKVGDVKLDLTKPILRTKNGYYIDINGDAIKAVTPGEVVSFNSKTQKITIGDSEEEINNAIIDGFYVDKGSKGTTDAPVDTLVRDIIVKKESELTTLNSSDLFNVSENRLTANGNELVRKLQELNYDLYDVDYTINTSVLVDNSISINISKKVDGKTTKVADLKIVKDDADTKGLAYKAMKEIILENKIGDKIVTAAGADRYETAAEVSRKGFATLTNEKAIVLVTGAQDKLVDGLTATPLAAALNGGDGAPVLLTGNDKIAQPVLDEIERLKAEKVYIVGGAISEEVEKELKTVYGMEVERVSGDDRYETSLEVANKMLEVNATAENDSKAIEDGKFTSVFVVGGKGEADALSAGSVAANLNAPILLTQADKLNTGVKHFLDKGTNDVDGDTKTYVVGGTSSVSEATYNQVLDIQGKDKIKRLSGAGRQETNAAVIEEFYTGKTTGVLESTNNIEAKKVVVAKSDNKGMVDALGAGLYAGVNDAPVVLATNSLVESQEDALKKITVGTDAQTVNKLQVGNGIAAAVAKFIKGL